MLSSLLYFSLAFNQWRWLQLWLAPPGTRRLNKWPTNKWGGLNAGTSSAYSQKDTPLCSHIAICTLLSQCSPHHRDLSPLLGPQLHLLYFYIFGTKCWAWHIHLIKACWMEKMNRRTNFKVQAILAWFTVFWRYSFNMVYCTQASILQVGTFCLKGYTGNHSMESDKRWAQLQSNLSW